MQEVPTGSKRQDKEIKGIQIGKPEATVHYLQMILYLAEKIMKFHKKTFRNYQQFQPRGNFNKNKLNNSVFSLSPSKHTREDVMTTLPSTVASEPRNKPKQRGERPL